MKSVSQSPLVEPLTKREKDVLALLVKGKTNREIAEALVLSINTVKWYNRQIYGKLGVENRDGVAERARHLGLIAGKAAAGRETYNLPHPATPLLGRERELEELEALVVDGRTRIVSIIGPGGMGKTRLAIELAHMLNGRFADGTAFVPLAPLQTEESIVPAIAQSLRFTFQGGGLDEKTQLLNFLREKKLLIFLDNYEHLIDVSPTLLREFAEAAPGLKMVVTSREKLKLRIEQLYPLQSLPMIDWVTVEQAEQDPAVQLFLEYGRRVRPGFKLQTEELGSIRQILTLVDGMPLAIILASAWLELLTPLEIVSEIEKNIGFLKADYQDLPGRQRSMRAVFDASWQLLDEAEQKVFSALSVFQGGFTLDAARKVAHATPSILLGLAGRSLLNRDENGRFEFHELLRQFAAKTLSSSPTFEANVRNNHSSYYLNLLESSESELIGANSKYYIEIIKADIDNVYEGWNRAVMEGHFLQLGSACFSLTYFTNRTGRYKQTLTAFSLATTRINDSLSRITNPDKTIIAVQIKILAYQCDLHHKLGDLIQAEAFGDESLSIINKFNSNNDDFKYEKALTLSLLGWTYSWLDRYDEARKLVGEGLELFQELGDKWQVARSHLILGGVDIRSANFEEAVYHQRIALQLLEGLGDRRWKTQAQMLLGFGLSLLGEVAEGIQSLTNSITIFQEIGEYVVAAQAMTILAEVLIDQGDFRKGQVSAARAMAENRRLGRDMWIEVSSDKWRWATLHIGDYDGVLEQVQSLLEKTPGNDSQMRLGRGHSACGEAWLAKQNLDKAVEHLKDGAAMLREIGARDYLCLSLGSLCSAYIKSGDISKAEKVIPEALDFALRQKTTLYLAATLPTLALLKAEKGELEKAVELFALTRREPYVTNSQWYEDVFGRFIAKASANLSSETVAAAEERGRRLDLWSTAESLLKELVTS